MQSADTDVPNMTICDNHAISKNYVSAERLSDAILSPTELKIAIKRIINEQCPVKLNFETCLPEDFVYQ